MPTYPVSLVLQDRAALVVGGGAVATRKVEGLLAAEAARYRFWQQATDGRVQRLVQAADEEAAEHLLEELLEGERTACATLL